MNDYEYVYTKLRKELGPPCTFTKSACVTITHDKSDSNIRDGYVHLSPDVLSFDCTPQLSSHLCNTDRVQVESRTQAHTEGGWPKEIDAKEPQETTKWRKRLEKDPHLTASLPVICKSMKEILDQNRVIDMFQEYFAGEVSDLDTEAFDCSTVGLFKLKGGEKISSVSKISWHPDGMSRIMVCNTALRAHADGNSREGAFIWDVESAGGPVSILESNWPLVTAQYCARNPELVAAGNSKGRVEFFDLRTGPSAAGVSAFEDSHHVAVLDLTWLQSKTHSEIVSTSPDGQVLWWDVRNLSSPTETCTLPTGYGGTSIEWQQEAGPTKYLVGTEQGVGLSLTKKPKKPVEVGGWFGAEDHGGQLRHHGPISCIRRNFFHAKYFMTVGDWTVKLWVEELKSPLFQTAAAEVRLTGGGWSTSRPGVLFCTRLDGYVDFYDLNYQMNEVALTHKVSDSAITASAINAGGNLLAVGDASGAVSLVRLCDDLAVPVSGAEKTTIGSILDREQRRERNLEAVRKMAKIPRTPADLSIASQYKLQGTIDQQGFLARERDWLTRTIAK